MDIVLFGAFEIKQKTVYCESPKDNFSNSLRASKTVAIRNLEWVHVCIVFRHAYRLPLAEFRPRTADFLFALLFAFPFSEDVNSCILVSDEFFYLWCTIDLCMLLNSFIYIYLFIIWRTDWRNQIADSYLLLSVIFSVKFKGYIYIWKIVCGLCKYRAANIRKNRMRKMEIERGEKADGNGVHMCVFVVFWHLNLASCVTRQAPWKLWNKYMSQISSGHADRSMSRKSQDWTIVS